MSGIVLNHRIYLPSGGGGLARPDPGGEDVEYKFDPSLEHLLRAGNQAADLATWGEVVDAFCEATEAGRLSPAEVTLLSGSLERAYGRLEGGSAVAKATGSGRIEYAAADTGGLKFGAPVPGVRFVG